MGRNELVTPLPGTRAAALYDAGDASESYLCNYGLSPEWEARLAAGGLRVGARGPDGEVRMVELDGHPFFAATLFLPQMRSAPGAPHPLIQAFADAAAAG